MAEEAENNNPEGLDKPAGTEQAKKEDTVIHVIPDRFYGATGRAKIKEPSPIQAPAAGPGGPQTPKPEKPAKKFPVAIVIVIVVFLLVGGGAAAYFLLFAKPAVKCGDGTCAASESYDSCPDDCTEPGPVCGDGTCEKPENYNTCSKDCEPPTVCGDAECEEGEDYKSCPGDCKPPEAECGNGKCEDDLGETYKECPKDCMPPEPDQAPDTDSDGLTDDEEKLIYMSDPNRSNSDGDSFVDLNEVLNLFDPAKPDPAVLVDSAGIATYSNEDYGIDIYRPKSWSVREIVAERTVNFTAPTGEVVKVMVFDKKEGQNLMDWYLDQPLEGMSGQVESGTSKKGYEQVITANRRTVYVSNGNTVVVLKYELEDQLEIRYRVTLTMMANSLTITGKTVAAPPAEPVDTGPALPVSRGAADEGTPDEEPAADEEGTEEEPPSEEPPPEEQPEDLPER